MPHVHIIILPIRDCAHIQNEIVYAGFDEMDNPTGGTLLLSQYVAIAQ